MVAQVAGQVTLSSTHRPVLTLEVTCTLRPELRHHAYRFERHLPVLPVTDIKVKDRVIGREGANADTELITPFRHVIEIRDPVSQCDGIVVRKQVAQRTEPDLLRPQQRLSDQQIGGRARLSGRGKVFSNPRFLEAERVKPLKVIQIPALAIPYRPLGRVYWHQ